MDPVSRNTPCEQDLLNSGRNSCLNWTTKLHCPPKALSTLFLDTNEFVERKTVIKTFIFA